MHCNLCGCTEFADFNSRIRIQCMNCGSLERTRLLWLYLQRMPIDQNTKILHIAPERGIYEALFRRTAPANYITADIDPSRYPFARNCTRIDLCNLEQQPSFQYDLILHSHVLEHIPCNITYTFYHLHRMLKENGTHLFIIPFMEGEYEESFRPLSHEERTRRFGQFDHIRRFGAADVKNHIGKILNVPEEFDATRLFPEHILTEANIPQNHWRGFQMGTVLSLKRKDMKFL